MSNKLIKEGREGRDPGRSSWFAAFWSVLLEFIWAPGAETPCRDYDDFEEKLSREGIRKKRILQGIGMLFGSIFVLLLGYAVYDSSGEVPLGIYLIFPILGVIFAFIGTYLLWKNKKVPKRKK